MKTTLELPASLLEEAKAHARKRRLTLRQLMEEGLRTVLERDAREAKPFRLRDCSRDLGAPLIAGGWPEIRKVIYEGRGE